MKHFIDQINNFRRGPAIINPKDAGLIISITGVGKDSVVLDAGTGSGFLTAYLANICKRVISYEYRKEFYDIAKANLKDFKNITLKHKDIYKGIKEKNLDLITLDLKDPWKVFPYVKNSLKPDRFIVCYLPTINQVMKIAKEVKKYKLKIENVFELLQREWHFEEITRPKSQMIAHTGFLVLIKN